MTSSLFQSLNAPQLEAVRTVKGRVLVLAGAGSGKTSVLTARIVYLIQDQKVSPDAILGLTFTNKAAKEMKERLGRYLPAAIVERVNLSTFHSFALKILKEDGHHLGFNSHFTLYEGQDVQRLMMKLVREELDHDSQLPSLLPMEKAIEEALHKGKKYHEIVDTGSKNHDTLTQKIFMRLRESLIAHNAMDFNYLLYFCVELFSLHPNVLHKWQDHYHYIMIDEYQDTNPIQYELAQLLSQKKGNLFVVGDDDQSIYGWRGAELKNILEFQGDKIIKLEQNYRSTHTILEAANAVIQQNQHRHEKAMWSRVTDGEPIVVFHAPTDVEEAEAVVYKMDRLRQSKGLYWRDMAILYRSNALAKPLEMALRKYTWCDRGDRFVQGVPYEVFGGTGYFERREIKDLVAYLRVLVNPRDEAALLRIINTPRRGIGEGTLTQLSQYAKLYKCSLWNILLQAQEGAFSLGDKTQHHIGEFIRFLTSAQEQFQKGGFDDVMLELIHSMDYQRCICEEVKSDKMRDFRWNNVVEFIESMKNFKQKSQKKPTIAEFLTTLSLDGPDASSYQSKVTQLDYVSLMTFHSAKGLEFTACFLIGLEDHIIPHERSQKVGDFEEERRLMYVGMTRAKRYLHLSMAQKRQRMGKLESSKPSRFLFEIPKSMLRVVNWQD